MGCMWAARRVRDGTGSGMGWDQSKTGMRVGMPWRIGWGVTWDGMQCGGSVR